jgi:hypothetical protein
MPAIICNTPVCLIPKELFKEEKIQEYWNILYPHPYHENLAKDDLERYFLLYPKPKEASAIHDISSMYKKIQEKYSHQADAICINVYDEVFNLIALKENAIVYAGHFCFSVKEDVLYHLTNISQQFFENIPQVTFFYQQLSSTILRLLTKYYEMKKL